MGHHGNTGHTDSARRHRQGRVGAERETGPSAKADEHHTAATGLFLTTAQNQGDWDKYLADAKARGASDAVLAQFPTEFSPQALNIARVLAQGKPDEPAKAGTLEDYMAKWAKEHGNVPVSSIAGEQLLKLRKQYAEAGHITNVAGGDITDAMVPDYVKVITENPGAYRGLTETAKSRLMVPLAKAGFTGFDAPTQASVTSANNVRGRALLEDQERRATKTHQPSGCGFVATGRGSQLPARARERPRLLPFSRPRFGRFSATPWCCQRPPQLQGCGSLRRCQQSNRQTARPRPHRPVPRQRPTTAMAIATARTRRKAWDSSGHSSVPTTGRPCRSTPSA